MKLLLCLCIVCGLAYPLFAQSPYLQPIPYLPQLPTKNIYDMLADRQGRIYLGTDKGLFRFNGKTAQKIPFANAKQADITTLREDKRGRIWGLNFAKQIFYTENDTLHNFPFLEGDSYSALVNFEFTEKYIWIATNTTLVAYNLHDFKPVFSKKFEKAQEHLVDMISYQNHIKIYVYGAVFTLDEQMRLTTEKTSFDQESRFFLQKDKLYCLQRKEASRTYMVWDSPTKPFWLQKTDLPPDVFLYHACTTPEQVWLCTRQGGYILSPETGKTTLVFPNKNITDILQDFQGNYWISTLNEGLWFCADLQNMYYPLPRLEGTSFELQSLFAQGEKLYLGLTNGHIWEASQTQPTQWQDIGKFADAEVRRVSFHPTLPLIATHNGVFDLKGKMITSFKKYSLKDAHFYTAGKQELLFITLSFGAYWIDLLSSMKDVPTKIMGCDLDTVRSQDFQRLTYSKLAPRRTYCAVADWTRQKFWTGTDNGLYEYDSTGKETILRVAGESIIAYQLLTDEQGRLWVSTFQQGIFVVENRRIVAHFQEGKPLKSNFIRKMTLQGNKLWISTDAEIGYVNTQNFRFQEILTQDGRDFCPTENGIWLALPRGVVFMAGEQTRKLYEPRLLPVRQVGNATFVVEALHYKNPTAVALHYRLKGKNWRIVKEPQTLLDYNELPQGDYEIEVFAQDETNKTRSETQYITFKIPPRWWETRWWHALVWTSVSATIFGFTYGFFERKRKKQLLKEQLWISQLKALRAQMNPHFLYNILNTVQGLVYSNRKTEASELLGNFSDLMRKSLQTSENAYISLREELDILTLYLLLEKARFDESFEYEFIYQNLHEYMHLKIPSMLIQPFVENAINHGLLHKKGAKHLHIHFDIKSEVTYYTLTVIIDDNGVGRQASAEINQRFQKKSLGFATRATTQRIELLNLEQKNHINYHIYDKVQGTKVEIIIHIPIT